MCVGSVSFLESSASSCTHHTHLLLINSFGVPPKHKSHRNQSKREIKVLWRSWWEWVVGWSAELYMWPILFSFVFSSAMLWMGGNVGERMRGGSVCDKLGHKTLRNLFPCPSLWGNHNSWKHLSLLIIWSTLAFSSQFCYGKQILGFRMNTNCE